MNFKINLKKQVITLTTLAVILPLTIYLIILQYTVNGGKMLIEAQNIFYIVLLVGVVTVLGLTLWLVRRIVNPIMYLEKSFKQGQKGDLTTVRISGPPELENLANAYNEMVIELNKQTEKLIKASMVDELTGCFNRRYLVERLTAELSRAKRENNHLSALFLDVNKMKALNDKYGHLAGDQVLIALVNLIKEEVRECDVLARFGGDEFIFILPNTAKEQVLVVGERLNNKLQRKHITFGLHVIPLPQLAFGSATFPEEGETVNDILQVADDWMYKKDEIC